MKKKFIALSFVPLAIIALAIFAGMTSDTFASGTKTITRGQSAVINWAVTNGSSCTPDTTYPSTGDTVYNTWSGAGTTASGAKTFSNITNVGTFVFTCSYSGISDSTTLIVQDCAAGTSWNGTSCIVPPPSSCPVASKSWGSGCSGSTVNTSSGSSYSVPNAAGGFNGSATYSCSNGVWSGPTVSSCTPVSSYLNIFFN
jgi:hypothetical protein